MGRYHHLEKPPLRRQRPWQIHPIWRGLGCLLVFIIPILAYGIAVYLVEENWRQGWVYVPRSMLAPGEDPNLYLVLLVTFALTFLVYAVITLVYLIIYRFVGPPLHTPLDVPPVRRRRRR